MSAFDSLDRVFVNINVRKLPHPGKFALGSLFGKMQSKFPDAFAANIVFAVAGSNSIYKWILLLLE